MTDTNEIVVSREKRGILTLQVFKVGLFMCPDGVYELRLSMKGQDTPDQDELVPAEKCAVAMSPKPEDLLTEMELYERKVDVENGQRVVTLVFIHQQDHAKRYS